MLNVSGQPTCFAHPASSAASSKRVRLPSALGVLKIAHRPPPFPGQVLLGCLGSPFVALAGQKLP